MKQLTRRQKVKLYKLHVRKFIYFFRKDLHANGKLLAGVLPDRR